MKTYKGLKVPENQDISGNAKVRQDMECLKTRLLENCHDIKCHECIFHEKNYLYYEQWEAENE